MILDSQNLFSDGQAVTASAASTNYIDLGAGGTPYEGASALGRAIGKGVPIALMVQVSVTFATLTSLAVSVETDDNTSFSSATTVVTTPAIGVASLVAGYRFPLEVLPHGINERYLRLYYTVAGSNATAGAIDAGLVADLDTNIGS